MSPVPALTLVSRKMIAQSRNKQNLQKEVALQFSPIKWQKESD
jgi:predicted nucleic acid-binding Zn ribbon protein